MMYYHCQLEDFDNASLTGRIEETFRQITGVRHAEVDFATSTVVVGIDSPETLKRIKSVSRSLGINLRNPVAQRKITLELPELIDQKQQRRIREFIAKNLHIGKCTYDNTKCLATFFYDSTLSKSDLLCMLNNHGVKARLHISSRFQPRYCLHDFLTLIATFSVLVGVLLQTYLTQWNFWGLVAYTIAALAIAPELGRRGLFLSFVERRINTDFLVLLCVVTALIYDRWMESAFLAMGYAIILLFNRFNINRMHFNLTCLKSRLPPIAHVVYTDNTTKTVAANSVKKDSVVRVSKGEFIPIDGRVIAGNCMVNTGSVTGADQTIKLGKSSKAYAGYKLLSGEIDVQTRVPQNESVFALALEELDRQQKLPIPELVKIHNIGQWVTYTMVLLALIIGIYTYSSSGNLSWSQAEKILMILLLAGTTSFILSSRLIFVSAIARLSQWGIYVKRSDIWWTLANIQQLLVEKTGTLTYNRPEVTEVVSVGSTPIRSVISLAASLCVKGEKRLHRTILRHAKSREAEFEKAVDIVPHHNGALEGTINNKRYQLAPSKRLAEMGLDAPEVVSKLSIWETETTNALLLFEEGKVIGVITFTDPIREEIGEFVDMLRVAKVKEITLLTSDNAFPTNAFAHRYGYDVAVGELDTDDKIKYVNNKFDAQPNTILMSNNRNLTDNCYALTACVDNASARTPMKRGDISIIPGDPTYVTHVFRIAKTATGRLKNMIVLMVLFKLILGWFVLTGKITLWETAAAELVFAVYALFTAISPNSASKVQLPKPETGIVLKPSSRTRSLMRSGRRKKGLIF